MAKRKRSTNKGVLPRTPPARRKGGAKKSAKGRSASRKGMAKKASARRRRTGY